MQTNSDAIFEAALKLPEADRFALAARLMETVPEEVEGLSMDDPNLAEELARRSADLEGCVPWSELYAEG